MIIVPTEKRFDWRHAPVVLFAIVVVNILVFFFYQAGDDEIVIEVLESYERQQFLEIEWPGYQKYLASKGAHLELERLKSLHEKGQHQQVSGQILLDQEFFFWTDEHPLKFKDDHHRYDWYTQREKLNQKVASISYLAGGVVPSNIEVADLISHQFLHGGLMHLMGNLFFLIVCGFAVEAAVGHIAFLVFYLVGGVVGALAHSLFFSSSGIPLVGASGAISAVMAMYLCVFRLKKIEFFYWLFVFVGYFRAPALIILPFYIGKEIYSYFAQPDANIAFLAHAGGFIAGGVLILLLFTFKSKVIDKTYIETDQTVTPLQRKLAEVYKNVEVYRFEVAKKKLAALISEYGERFDWLLLFIRLDSLAPSKSYNTVFKKILLTPQPVFHEVEAMESVWRENPKRQGLMEPQQMVKLGVIFCDLPKLDSAERIFNYLYKKHPKTEHLDVLANRLATVCHERSDGKKSRQYRTIHSTLTGQKI